MLSPSLATHRNLPALSTVPPVRFLITAIAILRDEEDLRVGHHPVELVLGFLPPAAVRLAGERVAVVEQKDGRAVRFVRVVQAVGPEVAHLAGEYCVDPA